MLVLIVKIHKMKQTESSNIHLVSHVKMIQTNLIHSFIMLLIQEKAILLKPFEFNLISNYSN